MVQRASHWTYRTWLWNAYWIGNSTGHWTYWIGPGYEPPSEPGPSEELDLKLDRRMDKKSHRKWDQDLDWELHQITIRKLDRHVIRKEDLYQDRNLSCVWTGNETRIWSEHWTSIWIENRNWSLNGRCNSYQVLIIWIQIDLIVSICETWRQRKYNDNAWKWPGLWSNLIIEFSLMNFLSHNSLLAALSRPAQWSTC